MTEQRGDVRNLMRAFGDEFPYHTFGTAASRLPRGRPPEPGGIADTPAAVPGPAPGARAPIVPPSDPIDRAPVPAGSAREAPAATDPVRSVGAMPDRRDGAGRAPAASARGAGAPSADGPAGPAHASATGRGGGAGSDRAAIGRGSRLSDVFEALAAR